MTRTRLLRLSAPETIRERIKEFLGKKINIVLADNRVVAGELMEVQQASISIRNMRLKMMFFPLTDISEIYLDTLA
jgi:hypothetical protein